MNFAPFHLCILLRTPIIAGGQLTLDAVLSAAQFRATADPEQALTDLPLQQTEGVWHASSAWFEQPVSFVDIPYVQRLNGEQDWSLEHFHLARRRKGDIKIDTGGGPYVARLDRHKARAVRRVHFFGCGDAEQAAQLVQSFLPGLGSKTNHGFGRIDTLGITAIDTDRSLLDTLGRPMRPLPLPFWRKQAGPMAPQHIAVNKEGWAVNEEGWRPPYWDRNNWALCAAPSSRDVDQECLSAWLL